MPVNVAIISSGDTASRPCMLLFAPATGASPVAASFIPGTSTNHSQAAFRKPALLVATDPRADHQPLIKTSYANLPTTLWVTQILLCSKWTAPTKGSSLSASDVVDPDLGSSAYASSSVGAHGRPCPISSSTETLKRWRTKGKSLLRSGIGVDGLCQLLSSLLLS